MKTIEKIALAVIKDKKVLMARSRKNSSVFYMLAGKIEEDETDEECLVREIKEEADVGIAKDSLEFLGVFSANAHDKADTIIVIRLYKGELRSAPVASSEVAEIAYFDSSMPEKHQSELVNQVLSFLKEKGFIN